MKSSKFIRKKLFIFSINIPLLIVGGFLFNSQNPHLFISQKVQVSKKIINKDFDFYFDLGDKKQESDDYEGSISDFTEAIKLKPDHAKTYLHRGKSKEFAGDIYGALEDYNKSIELDSTNPVVFNERGNIKGELGDLAGSIVDYTKAISIDPLVPVYYMNRAISKDDMQDYKGAISDYKKGLEINPEDMHIFYNLGSTHWNAGETEKACLNYLKASELGYPFLGDDLDSCYKKV